MARSMKLNLADKVDDGEMDLSMCDLQDVPVKEIAGYKKIWSLDLSNNHLLQLNKNFPTLTNLTKLDLSKNNLKKLPENFGDLTRLKHLDLYKNELVHLPLSFAALKNLKWLDLKDNPLVPAIQEAAGDCQSTMQCQQCATNIVFFFSKLKEKVDEEKEARDKERQKEVEKQRIAELAEKVAAKPSAEKKTKKEKAGGVNQQHQTTKLDKPPHDTTKRSAKSASPPAAQFAAPETKAKRSLWTYFFASVLLVTSLLFVFTAIGCERTRVFEGLVAQTWHDSVKLAHPRIRNAADTFERYFVVVHRHVGAMLVRNEEPGYLGYLFGKIQNIYDAIGLIYT